ncbi:MULTISPECIES: T9SS type A sorting domain-containing protein [Chryseobacterium]|uniref:T9SS type A sorting domain-containing protein n=1 Tax=Chryseobacterium TaxID=59732 RepID=UPI00129788FF|nr:MULTISPECIES: T9SS type A sorting domain-containing protein [Chryseobacterium]MDR6922031.1 hypothetical protein [Chryseobacterium sp. 2987]
MKKILLTLSLAFASLAWAQFSSETVMTPVMTVKLVTDPTKVTLTLTGDSNSMLGIGFGNSGMGAGADGFIYNSSANRDYSFSGVPNAPSPDSSQDWTQTSNTVSGSIRTIVATRSLSGGAGDFAIPNAAGTINIFYARRLGNQDLGYHGNTDRGYATLTMTATTLGTSEVAAENKKVNLYPNPAKETVSIKNADKIKSVEIYDSTGRKVRTANTDGENINISDLKSGIYYFEVTLKDGNKSYEKLIKE